MLLSSLCRESKQVLERSWEDAVVLAKGPLPPASGPDTLSLPHRLSRSVAYMQALGLCALLLQEGGRPARVQLAGLLPAFLSTSTSSGVWVAFACLLSRDALFALEYGHQHGSDRILRDFTRLQSECLGPAALQLPLLPDTVVHGGGPGVTPVLQDALRGRHFSTESGSDSDGDGDTPAFSVIYTLTCKHTHIQTDRQTGRHTTTMHRCT
jgi:hypothetical protein